VATGELTVGGHGRRLIRKQRIGRITVTTGIEKGVFEAKLQSNTRPNMRVAN
jgi:hypothetical protein